MTIDDGNTSNSDMIPSPTDEKIEVDNEFTIAVVGAVASYVVEEIQGLPSDLGIKRCVVLGSSSPSDKTGTAVRAGVYLAAGLTDAFSEVTPDADFAANAEMGRTEIVVVLYGSSSWANACGALRSDRNNGSEPIVLVTYHPQAAWGVVDPSSVESNVRSALADPGNSLENMEIAVHQRQDGMVASRYESIFSLIQAILPSFDFGAALTAAMQRANLC